MIDNEKIILPLYDESTPSLKAPYVTLGLILINVLIFSYVLLNGDLEKAIENYGTIPEQILGRDY